MKSVLYRTMITAGFLKNKMPGLEANVEGGSFVDAQGNILGKHRGYPFYTIGQRKGLDIAFGKPVYVTAIHPENNTVVLGEEKDLAGQTMMVSGLNMQKYDISTRRHGSHHKNPV